MHRLAIRNIVCASASLDRRTDALRHASSLANAIGTRLHVLHPHGQTLDGTDPSLEPRARTTVTHGEPGSETAAYAVRTAAELVVIGHGRSLPHTMNIVSDVVRHAGCPVLAVPTGLPMRKRSGGYDEIVLSVWFGLSTFTLRCALTIAQECQAR